MLAKGAVGLILKYEVSVLFFKCVLVSVSQWNSITE